MPNESRPNGPIDVAPNLRVLPLRTPTLPPATHTNTSFVGRHRIWVVDPATPHEGERARLLDTLDGLTAEGATLAGIVLTHHHRDHIGAAAWLAETRGIPISAHKRTAALIRASGAPVPPIHRVLREGDSLADGRGEPAWAVLHTPGHASDHLVLWESSRRLMVAGDMVAGVGSIIIDPPDGHMATYLNQLRRLRALNPAVLVPAHGPISMTPELLLSETIAHREAREALVVGALGRTPRTLSALTIDAYPALAPGLRPFAERAALAHLIKLTEEGRAVGDRASGWRRDA